MPIKPVDFQVMIPRSMEAAKVSNDINQKNLAMQQQRTSAMQHKAEDSLKQVYARAQAQDARITDKQKENRKNDKKRKNNNSQLNEKEQNEHNKLNHDIKSSIIDIKV